MTAIRIKANIIRIIENTATIVRVKKALIPISITEEILTNIIEGMSSKKNSTEDKRNSIIKDIRIKMQQEEIWWRMDLLPILRNHQK